MKVIQLIHLLLLSAAASAQGLQVTNGGHLILNGSVKLVLHNAGITNNGSISPGSSTVLFTGNHNVRIAGNNIVPFNSITINKSTQSNVVLHQDVHVDGLIQLGAGLILLNGHTLDMGATGNIFGESVGAQITDPRGGRILVTRKTAGALNAFNPGNIGLQLTTPVAPGIITVERRHTPQQVTPGNEGIQRSFTISSTVNTGLSATVRFFYLENELNGFNESNLLLWKGAEDDSSWIPVKATTVDINTNSLTIAGLDHWNRLTAASADLASLRTNAPVETMLEPSARVYPNPSRNVFTVQLFSPAEKNATLTLYDQFGRLLKKKQAHLVSGMNRVQWDLGHYAAGVYYIVFDKQYFKITKE